MIQTRCLWPLLATFLLGCGAAVTPGDARTDGNSDATHDGGPPPTDALPPPSDGTTPGCRAPDGRTLAPGETFFDGCNTCACQADGSLACTARVCLDGGPPPDSRPPPPPPPIDGGGFCRAPDGSILAPGEVWSDRCSMCLCQPDGSGALLCGGRPCTDGGPPPPPPPIDGGGFCRAPDGTIVPPGGIWSDRCTDCFCPPDGSGGLACRGRPCTDGGPPPPPPPPPDAGVCIAPDGTVLSPGEAWRDACNECFCDFRGGLVCRTFCIDGGPPPPPPPPDAGPACNTISLAGVASPSVRTVATLPTMTGGSITDGRYELTDAAFVAPPGVPLPPLGPMVMEFTGGVMQFANATSGFEQHLTYWFMVAGDTFTLVPVCGASSMPTVMRYTASATQLVLQVDAGGGVVAQITLVRR